MDYAPLIKLASQYHGRQGAGWTGLSRLSVLIRPDQSDLEAYIYEPVLCLILQGSKETTSGNQTAILQQGDGLLVSHNLPVLSRITKASVAEPYTALTLFIDMQLVRSLYSEIGPLQNRGFHVRSLASGPAQPEWLEPLVRYLAMMNHPIDEKVLGTSLLREIHYRLLMSSLGRMLSNLMVLDSHASRIAKATHRLRTDFRSPLKVAELANEAGMSPTSFHEHFKSVTGTTPLQFQKELRLTEARNLLLLNKQSVTEAAFAVGYESAAQFSREFSRQFGSPPSRSLNKAVQIPFQPGSLGL